MSLPYAEDINYFQTSQSSPDTWMDKTKKVIAEFGGNVLAEGFGSEPQTGRSAYMLAFEHGGERYKVVFPVLPTKNNKNERAARIQAATLLYHDIKAKCLSATVFGVRAAFFNYLMLPNGRTVVDASIPELQQGIPSQYNDGYQLVSGEIVE